MNQQEVPVAITSARLSRSEDIRRRQMRYLMSMALRTACFVLAIVSSGPLRWFFVAGAVFLPYIAVVLANATDRRQGTGPLPYVADDVFRLEAAPDAASSRSAPGAASFSRTESSGATAAVDPGRQPQTPGPRSAPPSH